MYTDFVHLLFFVTRATHVRFKSFQFNWNHSHDMLCTICSKLSATIFRILISCTLKMEAAGASETLVTTY